FAPLLVGGQVWILSDDTLEQPSDLLRLMSARSRAGLNCVPSLWKAMLESFDSSPDVGTNNGPASLLLGGERITRELVDRTFVALPNIEIWNLYGPTETTANAIVGKVTRQERVTLGRPIANVRI